MNNTFNVNGPGFAGLYAGDTVLFTVGARGREYSDFTAPVLRMLVFADHVQVRYASFGCRVDAHNFVRLVRRGKRHIAADRDLAAFNACHPAD
jgi:hypothetical protein